MNWNTEIKLEDYTITRVGTWHGDILLDPTPAPGPKPHEDTSVQQ